MEGDKMSEGSDRIKEFYKRMAEGPFGHTAHPEHYAIATWTGKSNPKPAEISEGWEDAFGQAVSMIADVLAERQQESAARLRKLEQEVRALKQQLVQGNQSILAPIYNFAPEPYVLTRDVINVLVVPDDGSFVATLVDANINASGETVPEAVANLKDMMIGLFEKLSREPKENLGKWPTRQFAVLRELMRRKVRHGAHQQTARQ
jgi:predicted RNase H-like HicB family nuclease